MVTTPPTWSRTNGLVWSGHGWSVEVRDDEFAEIRHGDHIILRSVRAVVRDSGWLTVPAVVTSLRKDGSGIELGLRHEGLGAYLISRLSLTVTAAEMHIAWRARNTREFDTCRTGLVVLHPASDAGSPLTVTHTDGAQEQTAFPLAIAPHQPVIDIREMRIREDAVLCFDGDVFEMEDQRNWTDASFKTYSRPLALPYPYRLGARTVVQQSLSIGIPAEAASGARTKDDIGESEESDLFLVHADGDAPAIGVEASTAPDPVAPSAIGGFRVVELDLRTDSWRAALDRALADRLPVDVRLVVGEDTAILDAAVRALADKDVLRITAFDAAAHITDARVRAALRRACAAEEIDVPVLAGARSHFTELNREQRQVPRDVDGMSVTLTPLFHSLDTEQIVESLAMQRIIAKQTVTIADGLPVHIGPVSLRPRYNNVATVPQPLPQRDDLLEGYGAQFTGAADPRQHAPELAAWLIASAAALAVPGVASLSWFETWGPRGLITAAGRAPAADALDALAGFSGRSLLTGDSPDGLIWALGARGDDDDIVLIANLDRRPRHIRIHNAEHEPLVTELAAGAWASLTIRRR